MAKEYIIENVDDVRVMFSKIKNYIDACTHKGIKFPSMRIIVKKLQKQRSKPQLRYYWITIGELQKGFKSIGYEYTKETIHEFIKREAGYTEVVEIGGELKEMVLSIADKSDDATVQELVAITDFAKRFSAEKLNYVIEN